LCCAQQRESPATSDKYLDWKRPIDEEEKPMDANPIPVKCESLTFVIFVKNEERRLPFVIRNLIAVGRILVVDNCSEDKTVEIARAAGCDVLTHHNTVGYVEEPVAVGKIWAAVKTEWIHWGFADEIMDQATLDAIVNAVQSPSYRIVNIARKNYYYGTFLERAFIARTNRIFRKDAIDFSVHKIHHFGRVTVPDEQICYLDENKYFVHHFISNTAKSYIYTMNLYTDTEAACFRGSLSGFVLGLKLLKLFTLEYIVRGAFRRGFDGLSLVILNLIYKCLATMKAYELAHHLNNGGIEKLNDQKRIAILDAMDNRSATTGTN
jgi:glycosyltransferase involved in cell wall biosynthesis